MANRYELVSREAQHFSTWLVAAKFDEQEWLFWWMVGSELIHLWSLEIESP